MNIEKQVVQNTGGELL